MLLAAVDGKCPGKAPLHYQCNSMHTYTFKRAKHHLFRDHHEIPGILMLDTVLEWQVKIYFYLQVKINVIDLNKSKEIFLQIEMLHH